MSKRIKINVTQRDIERANEYLSNPHREKTRSLVCPIARAAHRHSELKDVHVTGSMLWEEHGDYRVAELPTEAVVFVNRFDTDRAVEPFTFTVEIEAK